MSEKNCALGEDCDLTIAWMAGAESVKPKYKSRIKVLTAERDELAKKLAKAVRALEFIGCDDGPEGKHARITLAELKEQDNE